MQTDKMSRDSLPIIGIVGLDYMRERGLRRLMEVARVVAFSPADSTLHRMADFSCPVATLDCSEQTLHEEVNRAIEHGIKLEGLLSWRDYNIPAVASIAHEHGWRSINPQVIPYISNKSCFRQWLADNFSSQDCLPVPFRSIPNDCDKPTFHFLLSDLLDKGSVILKPDRGSCSYYVLRISSIEELEKAWGHFVQARSFRGGDFIAEQEINGLEVSVETACDEGVIEVRATQYLPGIPNAFLEIGHFVEHNAPPWTIAACELARAIHSRLPLRHVVTHTEMIVPAYGPPAIVEINPRLAGDLIPELHHIVHGIDYYALAGLIAAGRKASFNHHLTVSGLTCSTALVRFNPPIAGRIQLRQGMTSLFRSIYDQCGLLYPRGSVCMGGMTNDDRPAYALLAGEDREELDTRARALLQGYLYFD